MSQLNSDSEVEDVDVTTGPFVVTHDVFESVTDFVCEDRRLPTLANSERVYLGRLDAPVTGQVNSIVKVKVCALFLTNFNNNNKVLFYRMIYSLQKGNVLMKQIH